MTNKKDQLGLPSLDEVLRRANQNRSPLPGNDYLQQIDELKRQIEELQRIVSGSQREEKKADMILISTDGDYTKWINENYPEIMPYEEWIVRPYVYYMEDTLFYSTRNSKESFDNLLIFLDKIHKENPNQTPIICIYSSWSNRFKEKEKEVAESYKRSMMQPIPLLKKIIW